VDTTFKLQEPVQTVLLSALQWMFLAYL